MRAEERSRGVRLREEVFHGNRVCRICVLPRQEWFPVSGVLLEGDARSVANVIEIVLARVPYAGGAKKWPSHSALRTPLGMARLLFTQMQ